MKPLALCFLLMLLSLACGNSDKNKDEPETNDTDTDAGPLPEGPYEWTSVAIRGGGFVPGVIFSPAEAGVIYARTDMAGAYRFDDDTYTWIPITDWMDREDFRYFGIESIAPDPVNPDVVYMAAGTYLSSGEGIILKSDDRGDTWTRHEIGVAMGGNHSGRSMGERLAVDPNDTSILYFGSRQDGLLKSTDAGETWESVEAFPVTGGRDLGLGFVFFNKVSGQSGSGSSVIYVGAADTSSGSNLYRTVDSGDTWEEVPGGPSGWMPHHIAEASDGMLYLTYSNGPGPGDITDGGVFKLDPSEDTWTDITPSTGTFGYGGIAVSPDSPGTLLTTTIDWWAPDEIFRSEDGGDTWSAISRSVAHDQNGAEYLCWGEPGCSDPSAQGWMGDIDIDPFDESRAFHVTGQGIWVSENVDADATELLWTFENNGLEQTVVLDMPASFNGAVFSVVGDIGGMRHALDKLEEPPGSGMYQNPTFGNGDGLDFAGLAPDIVVRCGTFPHNGASDDNGGFSEDGGRTWKPFPSFPGEEGRGGKIAVSADGATIIWNQGAHPAYSRDLGETWTPCEGLDGNIRVTSDRVNPNKFYAYHDGTLYLSEDGGERFAPASEGLVEFEPDDENFFPPTGRVFAVFDREGDVWVVADNRLFRSTDAGQDAEEITTVDEVNAVGFGKGLDYPVVFLVGIVDGVYGVFRSEDQAEIWTRINDDDHQFGSIDYVAGDENLRGRAYIGTHGRGLLFGDPVE